MKKTIYILLTAILFVFLSTPVAAQKHAGQSAVLSSTVVQQNNLSLATQQKRDVRKLAIKAVLTSYNSPMVDDIDAFMQVCEDYQLNCYLLPAIAGVESGFGNHYKQGTYNPFGWGGGKIYFTSWSDGINTVGKSLRHKYINRGAITLDDVGSIYAASPVWSAKVRKFMNMFEHEEAQLEKELNSGADDVQL